MDSSYNRIYSIWTSLSLGNTLALAYTPNDRHHCFLESCILKESLLPKLMFSLRRQKNSLSQLDGRDLPLNRVQKSQVSPCV